MQTPTGPLSLIKIENEVLYRHTEMKQSAKTISDELPLSLEIVYSLLQCNDAVLTDEEIQLKNQEKHNWVLVD
jgi:hypothetical protein